MLTSIEQKGVRFNLFAKRNFLPLFVSQSLEAFNDNLLKTALAILITYEIGYSAHQAINLVAMTSVLIMLPYLLSPIAGQIADKYEKSSLICFIKLIEFIAMSFASLGFIAHSVPVLMIALFIMGAHSTFLSPLKYSILPQSVHADDLVKANGWIDSGIFVAIVLGTLSGSYFIKYPNGELIVSTIGMAAALLGLLSSFMIPAAKAQDPHLRINFNIFSETAIYLKNAKRNTEIWHSVIGTAWFWLNSVCLFNLLPVYTKHVLHTDPYVLSMLLCVLAIGITAGAAIVQSLLKNQASFKYVPFGLLGMSIGCALLGIGHFPKPAGGGSFPLGEFLTYPSHWTVFIELFICAVFAGIFVVPQHAVMLIAAESKERSRMIAIANFVSGLFMVAASLAIEFFNRLHVSIDGMFLLLAVLNILLFLVTMRKLPEEFLKTIIKWTLKSLYRVEIKGLEHYYAIKDKAIIISNHVSYLDGMLLCSFLPDQISFAINTYVANQWWCDPFLKVPHCLRLDSSNPMSIKTLIRELDIRKRCIIFPEGRITSTGRLMKIYEGPALVADKCGAEILPIRLEGVQYSFFASLKDVFRRKMFPKITITIMPPRTLECDAVIKGSKRREYLGLLLYDMMSELMFDSSDYRKNLLSSFLDAARLYDRHKRIIEDSDKNEATYSKLIKRTAQVAEILPEPKAKHASALVLLEPGVNYVATLFALQIRGYLPVLLNDASDTLLLQHAMATSKAEVVVVSKLNRFYKTFQKLETGIDELEIDALSFENLPSFSKAKALVQRGADDIDYKFPAFALFSRRGKDDVGGTIVTHENIQASRFQLTVCLDYNPNDSVFNAYSRYHMFSLVAGLLMPILNGSRVVLQPAFGNVRHMPKLIADHAPTVLLADSHHLDAFAKEAYLYEFISLRYVFADGETLSDGTKELWREKFGIRILSGLFSQDISPVFALNTAMQHKPDTVGRLLPKIQYRVVEDANVPQGGRLFVSGPNVTRNWDSQEDIESKEWYDTGKLVDIDEHGFMTILGDA